MRRARGKRRRKDEYDVGEKIRIYDEKNRRKEERKERKKERKKERRKKEEEKEEKRRRRKIMFT